MGIFGIAPYLAPVLEQKRQRDRQTQQDTVAQQIQKDTAARQAAAEARAAAMNTANVGHVNAQTDALKSPKTPPHAFDQEGAPWIIHDNGDFERAKIRDGSSPAVTVPSAPSSPPSFDAPPMTEALRGSMGLRPTDAPTPPAPVQAPTQAPRLPVPQAAPQDATQAPTTPKFGPRAPTDPTKTFAANRDYAIKHPLPSTAQDDKTLVQVQQPDGTVIYVPRSKAAGMQAPGKTGAASLPAPMAAKVGQFGEMLKKSFDLIPSMNALDVKLGGSAAQDVAANGIGVGNARIPGTKGLGSMMLSKTPEYATYQAAITPFVLAAAHALSGARINNEQVQQIRASIELTPGMSPQERKQKKKNLVDLINSIGGSLPANAIGEQEAQMTPEDMAVLTGYGYRSRSAAPAVASPTPAPIGGRGSPPPNAPGTASPAGTPGNFNLGKITPEERAALKANGFTDAQLTAKYGPP